MDDISKEFLTVAGLRPSSQYGHMPVICMADGGLPSGPAATFKRLACVVWGPHTERANATCLYPAEVLEAAVRSFRQMRESCKLQG